MTFFVERVLPVRRESLVILDKTDRKVIEATSESKVHVVIQAPGVTVASPAQLAIKERRVGF